MHTLGLIVDDDVLNDMVAAKRDARHAAMTLLASMLKKARRFT
jgi:hypothetical protein